MKRSDRAAEQTRPFTLLDPLHVVDWADDGSGVAVHDGLRWHIAGAAPGDIVAARVLARSQHHPHGWARVERWHRRNEEAHRLSFCPNASQGGGKCDGCALIHLHREAQSAAKLSAVQRALADLPYVPGRLQTLGTDEGWRNRSYFVCQRTDGRIKLGAWSGGSHEFATVDGCVAVHPDIERLREKLELMLNGHSLPQVVTDSLRYVQIRTGAGKALLVEWISRADIGDAMATLVPALETCAPDASLWFAVNDSSGNVLRVAEAQHVSGPTSIPVRLGNREWSIGPASFFQLNAAVAEAMSARVGDLAAQAGTVTWDLYSGVGILGAAAADRGATVYGCDLVPEAVRSAASRTEHHTAWKTMDLRNFQPPAEWPSPHAVIVNPPRRGLDVAVRDWLARAPISRIVYMSCNPVSFQKDASWLLQNRSGLGLAGVEAWDMLPATTHTELIGWFDVD